MSPNNKPFGKDLHDPRYLLDYPKELSYKLVLDPRAFSISTNLEDQLLIMKHYLVLVAMPAN